MRVIGGKLRGKLIHNPTDKTTRPLKDMVRESIFNILEHSKNEKIKFKNDFKVLREKKYGLSKIIFGKLLF